jgi:peptidoglycan hydrolase CwlO-like protein
MEKSETKTKKKEKGFFAKYILDSGDENQSQTEVVEIPTPSGKPTLVGFSPTIVVSPTLVTSNSFANTIVNPSGTGVFDEKIYNQLKDAILAGDTGKIDYLKFSQAKKEMDKIPNMIEAVKYQMTFSSLHVASSALTKDFLLKSADGYLSILDKEQTDFDGAVQHTTTQINDLNAQASEKNEEILKKQEEISNLQAEILELQNNVGSMQQKVDSAIKNYKATMDVVRNEINQDKSNIQTYVQ